MTHLYKCFFLLFLCFLGNFSLKSQNLDGISLKKNKLEVSGSLSGNFVGYGATNIKDRRDPFNYFLSGSLNLSIFGYSMPFSFSYSNAGKGYSQPFNQFVFSPQYKWVKTYIGTTSMTFSPYTLAGHVFSGAGVELSPKNWRVGIMVGRLQKAVQFNLADSIRSEQNEKAAFRRMGYALKLGYEGKGGTLSGSVFYAKDDANSLTPIPSGTLLTPKQNIAVNFKAKKVFFKKLSAEMEYALSAMNNNTKANTSLTGANANPDSVSVPKSSNLLARFLPNNPTTQFFDVFSGNLGYQFEKVGVQVKYERIAPNYQSLGAYFFNNDMENYTIATTMALFKNKLSIASNIGLQKNNLDELKTAQTKRWVGSVNVSFAPNEKWTTGLNYSNFSSYTRVRPLDDPFFRNTSDTLNFYQIANNFDGTASYIFGDKKDKKTVILAASYQKSVDKAGSPTGANNLNNVYTLNGSYGQMLKKWGVQLNVGANYFLNENTDVTSSFFGPSLGLSKKYKKGLQMSMTNAYNANFTKLSILNKETVNTFNDVLNTRISLNYSKKEEKKGANNADLPPQAQAGASKKKKPSQTIGFTFQRTQRFKGTNSQPAFSEYTGTLIYTYSF